MLNGMVIMCIGDAFKWFIGGLLCLSQCWLFFLLFKTAFSLFINSHDSFRKWINHCSGLLLMVLCQGFKISLLKIIMPLMIFEDLFTSFQGFEALFLLFHFSLWSRMLEIEIRKDKSHNSGSGFWVVAGATNIVRLTKS